MSHLNSSNGMESGRTIFPIPEYTGDFTGIRCILHKIIAPKIAIIELPMNSPSFVFYSPHIAKAATQIITIQVNKMSFEPINEPIKLPPQN